MRLRSIAFVENGCVLFLAHNLEEKQSEKTQFLGENYFGLLFALFKILMNLVSINEIEVQDRWRISHSSL